MRMLYKFVVILGRGFGMAAKRITLAFLALLIGASLQVDAQTITAASCNASDVQAAITSAGRNGTVNVPAGSCTWSSPVTITTGLTLNGAGVGSTVITSSGGSQLLSISPDTTAISASSNIKITGFEFNGGGASGADVFIAIQGASGITGSVPYRYYIIANNKFENGNTTSSNGVIQAGGNGNGQLRGVIANNTFTNTNEPMRLFSNNDTGESSNPVFNIPTYGDENQMFFETNTINFTGSYAGANPGWIEVGQGAREVIRYNTYNFANATTPTEIWDIHGFQNWNGTVNSGQTGTMEVEAYGNTITNGGQYRWIDFRGSWGLFFDNIFTGTTNPDNELYGMSSPGSCGNQISPLPTNYIPQVNNAYSFNLTVNGTESDLVMNASGDPTNCSVTQNSNWWNYDATCTASACATGVGRGTTAPTGTCTTGVGYWVASTPGATTSSSVIQNGTFYKCTATNTWTLYYKPFTYPHPLLNSSPGPSPAAVLLLLTSF